MSEEKTNVEKKGVLKKIRKHLLRILETIQKKLGDFLSFIEKIIEKIGKRLPRIRNIFADVSRIGLWIGNYVAFVIVISLVIGSMWGIGNATLEMWEIIKGQTSDSPKDGDHQLYPKLIKIAEYYLISFTLFLIAVGIHRIISKTISEEIMKIEDLESLMIGLVVITMAVIFLDTIFGVAMRRVTWGMESVLMFGLAMAVVIVGLALYLKFREKRSESEVFIKKEKEEIYKNLKEELKKAIEERREEDKLFTKKEKEDIYIKLKEKLKKAIDEGDAEKIGKLIDFIKKLEN